MSRYDAIWNEIKRAGYVEITVSKDAARTVEQGIKRVKTAENVARRLAGVVGWGKLVVTRAVLSSTRIKIRLELLYMTNL